MLAPIRARSKFENSANTRIYRRERLLCRLGFLRKRVTRCCAQVQQIKSPLFVSGPFFRRIHNHRRLPRYSVYAISDAGMCRSTGYGFGLSESGTRGRIQPSPVGRSNQSHQRFRLEQGILSPIPTPGHGRGYLLCEYIENEVG